jgi:predicted Zn finger-like uncharacterized protein
LVATRCPKCATLGVFAAEDLDEVGRFLRCARCGTAWLARKFPDDLAAPAASPPARTASHGGTIIEGEVLKPGAGKAARRPRTPLKPYAMPPAPFAPRPSNRRLAVFGMTLTLIVLVGLAVPIVAAIPGLAGLFNAEGGLAIEKVKSASLRRGGIDTILVEGVLANHASHDVAVPAIRISLRTNAGGEVYSWEVEPTTTRLAPSESIGFRSALTNPVPGANQIAVSFVNRPLSIGMR